jgi:hypothetical protein
LEREQGRQQGFGDFGEKYRRYQENQKYYYYERMNSDFEKYYQNQFERGYYQYKQYSYAKEDEWEQYEKYY